MFRSIFVSFICFGIALGFSQKYESTGGDLRSAAGDVWESHDRSRFMGAEDSRMPRIYKLLHPNQAPLLNIDSENEKYISAPKVNPPENDLISLIMVKHADPTTNGNCKPSEEDITFTSYRNGELKVYNTGNSSGLKQLNNPKWDVIIHGYFDDVYTNLHQIITAYENRKDEPTDLLFVDWGPVSKCLYKSAVNVTVPAVGQIVGKFFNNLLGVNYTNIHLIGHGMGAQIASYAAKEIISKKAKFGRITGLDPAGPGFSLAPESERLDKNDADFVDVIYTNMNFYGTFKEIGHANFYPNGGDLQKGCADNHLCSRQRALSYYLESLYTTSPFYGSRCGDYAEYKFKMCPLYQYDPTAVMGAYTRASARGRYFLDTNMYPPFSKSPVA